MSGKDETMQAFHGMAATKAMFLTRARVARERGLLKDGTYGLLTPAGWEGCAVGVLIHGRDHAALAAALGIPRMIVDFVPGVFDGMPATERETFPERFVAAIPVGADCSLVPARFLHWLLVDERDGVIRFARGDQSRAAIRAVAVLFERVIAGETVTHEEWKRARSAAYAAYAADAAAYAAADAAYAAADAAYAAYAAADAADAAAYAAADAADAAAARSQARARQAERLLVLLREAPVPAGDAALAPVAVTA